MDFVFATSRRVNHSGPCAQRGFLKIWHAVALAVVAIAAVAFFKFGPSNTDSATGAATGKGVATDGPREVDFGFVELNPGMHTPITSYKHGGNMVLYAGEELRFQVVGAAPLPPVELRVGESAHALPGTDGVLLVAGPANQPLPASMVAQGARLSLPGSAPPRVSVKVQVHGAARPKK
ncbi:MAG: hypothetical protein ACKVQT_27210 [Burkholderiales bacterium]